MKLSDTATAVVASVLAFSCAASSQTPVVGASQPSALSASAPPTQTRTTGVDEPPPVAPIAAASPSTPPTMVAASTDGATPSSATLPSAAPSSPVASVGAPPPECPQPEVWSASERERSDQRPLRRVKVGWSSAQVLKVAGYPTGCEAEVWHYVFGPLTGPQTTYSFTIQHHVVVKAHVSAIACRF
jgi:hypothetical protein